MEGAGAEEATWPAVRRRPEAVISGRVGPAAIDRLTEATEGRARGLWIEASEAAPSNQS